MHTMKIRPITLSVVFALTFAGTCSVASAAANEPHQESRPMNNPFTLVYRNAITRNEPGKVNIHPVKYSLNGIEVVANVYTPAGFDPSKKYPAIVVAHPNGGVKEQVAGLYAQHLAEQGYITIAFDAMYQGGSGGKPRYVDKPANRIEDIRGAGDFISQYPGADAGRLGLLGICGGGGYSIKAAQTDKRFKSVATISMFNSGDARRNGFMRSQTDTIQKRLKQAADARAQEAAGGDVLYSPAFGAGMTPEQVAALPYEMYRQGYEYYAQTHAHPNSQTNYTLSSLLDLMPFDVNTNVDLIDQPLLMIAGDRADSLYMTEEVFQNATGTKNKELFKVKGATHIETYWKPEYVSQISARLTDFYGKNLAGTAARHHDTIPKEATMTSESTSPPAAETAAIQSLSDRIWQALRKRDTNIAETLIDDQAVFVHMGATLSKAQELEAIRTQVITLKDLDVEEQSVRFIGPTAILLKKLRLTAVVQGKEVTNPFVVTEVYVPADGDWKLASMSYTRLVG